MTTTYTLEQAVDILEGRAARYGGDISDMLDITPQSMWDNPDELVEFWDGRDLSHIMPKSVYPEFANDWNNKAAVSSYSYRHVHVIVVFEFAFNE